MSRILRGLGFGLGLETFANFWRVSVSVSENLVSEKNHGFGFGKFGLGKKVSVSVLENMVWKKVSVSVSVMVMMTMACVWCHQ